MNRRPSPTPYFGTSPILLIIQKIRGPRVGRGVDFGSDISPLHNYRVEFVDGMKICYVSAEVHPDCLDKGLPLPDNSIHWLARTGIPGDRSFQLIDKRLGGTDNDSNFVPLNSRLNLSAWKKAEDIVYEHVRGEKNRYARLIFGFEYDNGEDFYNYPYRPIKMYYHFVLYENNKIVGEPIEGEIVNSDPRKDNEMIEL